MRRGLSSSVSGAAAASSATASAGAVSAGDVAAEDVGRGRSAHAFDLAVEGLVGNRVQYEFDFLPFA